MKRRPKRNNAQVHDKYAKEVLRRAFESDFNSKPKPFKISKGNLNAGSIRVDGEIYGEIVVEIESRVSKQVRGAILDLFLHPYRKKLLIIMDKHGNRITPVQSEEILKRLCKNKFAFKVITLKGNGNTRMLNEDIILLKKAVKDLSRI